MDYLFPLSSINTFMYTYRKFQRNSAIKNQSCLPKCLKRYTLQNISCTFFQACTCDQFMRGAVTTQELRMHVHNCNLKTVFAAKKFMWPATVFSSMKELSVLTPVHELGYQLITSFGFTRQVLPRTKKGKSIIKFQRNISVHMARNTQILPCSHNLCSLPLTQTGLLHSPFNVFHKFGLQGLLAAVNYAYQVLLCQRKFNYSNCQGHRNIQRCQFDSPKTNAHSRELETGLLWKAGYNLTRGCAESSLASQPKLNCL